MPRVPRCYTLLVRCVAPLVGGIFMASPPLCQAADDATTILRHVAESRLAIKSGHVLLRSKGMEGSVPINFDWKIWFDGDKLRGDLTRGGYVDVSCFGCLSRDTHFSYNNRPVEGGQMGLTVYDLDQKDPTVDYVPQIRWLGCLPIDSFTSRHYHPIAFLGIGKPLEATIVGRETVAGADCVIVSWKDNKFETGIKAWVSPDEGYAIRRIESRWTSGNKIEFVDSVESSLQEYKHSGIWLPASWRYERTEDERVTRSEAAELEVLALNAPLGEKVFSLEGIEILKSGTPVMWVMAHDRPVPELPLVWNGKEIVGVPRPGRMTQAASPWVVGWVVGANLFIICAVAAALFFHHWRRRARTS